MLRRIVNKKIYISRYYCSNGLPTNTNKLSSGTLCYNGEIIHSYDTRCTSVQCQLPYPPVCGDKICNGTETCATCPQDISLIFIY